MRSAVDDPFKNFEKKQNAKKSMLGRLESTENSARDYSARDSLRDDASSVTNSKGLSKNDSKRKPLKPASPTRSTRLQMQATLSKFGSRAEEAGGSFSENVKNDRMSTNSTSPQGSPQGSNNFGIAQGNTNRNSNNNRGNSSFSPGNSSPFNTSFSPGQNTFSPGSAESSRSEQLLLARASRRESRRDKKKRSTASAASRRLNGTSSVQDDKREGSRQFQQAYPAPFWTSPDQSSPDNIGNSSLAGIVHQYRNSNMRGQVGAYNFF